MRHERVQLMPPVDAAEIPWVSLGSTPEWMVRRVQAPRRWHGAGRRLGSPAARALVPLRRRLRVALWVELDHGRHAARRTVPMLALLRRPVLQPELRLQRVVHRRQALERRARGGHQGGDPEQGRVAARRRGNQGEGRDVEAQGVREHSRGRVLVSEPARACEFTKGTIIFTAGIASRVARVDIRV